MENIKNVQQAEIERTCKKLHRAEQSREYIRSCQIYKAVPSFARLSKSTKDTLGKCEMSSSKIISLEQKESFQN